MKRQFSIKPTQTLLALEQDVKVTISEEKNVPVEIGDEVTILMRAKVANVYGVNLDEVELSNLTPVKVVGVTRKKGK